MRAAALPVLLLVLAAPSAVAAAEPAPVPEASFRAVQGRQVRIRMRDASRIEGELLAVERGMATVAGPDGAIVTVATDDVLTLELAQSGMNGPPPPPSAAAGADAPERARHIGVHLMAPPGIAIDAEYGLFYAFASTSLLFPLALSGRLVGFSAGAGVDIRISRGWRFDLFGHVSIMGYGMPSTLPNEPLTPYFGFGFGMGVHYTGLAGWSFGAKVPLLGLAIGTVETNRNLGAATAGYYFASVVSLPILSVGYRF